MMNAHISTCKKSCPSKNATMATPASAIESMKRGAISIWAPVGCRACGGPYPDCKTSCPMFDD